MVIEELVNEYMAQSSNVYSYGSHDAHNNGTTHTNSSGSHSDTKSGGGGHGDHFDTR